MNNKLDVFEILGVNNETDNQGQKPAPDADFNAALKQAVMEKSEKPSRNDKKASEKAKTVKQEKPAVKPASAIKQKPASPHKKPEAAKRRNAGRTIITIAVTVILIVLFFTFVIKVQEVKDHSMEPAMYKGDKAAVLTLVRNYRPGDVIMFRTADKKVHIRRIVAGPADVVNMTSEGNYTINGKTPDEPYIYTQTRTHDYTVKYPAIMSAGNYFVLGDNREEAEDSRNIEIGIVNEDDIIGKVIFCFRKI